MPYNSDSRTISATTTSGALNLPNRTAVILMSCPNTNTDFINVRLGGGAPIRMYAGDVKSISIEQVCLGYMILGQEPPPQIFITDINTLANSGTQTLIVLIQEWRVA